MGYLYLAKSGDVFKIGTTGNPKMRRRDLQVGNSFPFEFVCLAEFEDAKSVEMQMHERFKSRRERGEWFRLTDNDVETFKWGCSMLGGKEIEPPAPTQAQSNERLEQRILKALQTQRDEQGRIWFRTRQLAKILGVRDRTITEIGKRWQQRGWLSPLVTNAGRTGKNGRLFLR